MSNITLSDANTNLAETSMPRNGRGPVLWIKLGALADDTSEDVSKDCSLSVVLVVSKWQTLLEATLRVSADEVSQTRDHEFPKFSLSL